ncbi:MAG: hypothetical protein MdMp014T_0210 [Treponematales bacterium]
MTGANRIINAVETSGFEGARDEKTRNAVVSIFELGAKMAGKDLDTFLDDNFSVQIFDRIPDNSPEFEDKKGGMKIAEAGKTLIKTTNWSDLSTIAHEVQHVVQMNLPEQYRAEYSKVFGIDKTAFDKIVESLTETEREGFEKAVRAFEEYLYTGEAPTAKLKTLFDKMLGAGETAATSSRTGNVTDFLNSKKRRSNAQAGTRRGMKDLAAAAALYQDGQSNAQTGRNADNQEVNAIEARETAEWLLTAAPVAEVADNAIQRQGQRYEEVVGKLYKEKWNNLVQRGNWTVKLTKAGIIASLRHGYGRLKINAFAAVPEVILNGRIIDSNKNWKGRGYDSYSIAAPIRLGADDYLCEVIINTNKDGTFNFYLHEVIRKPRGAHSGGMDTTNAPGASTSNIARFLKKVKP